MKEAVQDVASDQCHQLLTMTVSRVIVQTIQNKQTLLEEPSPSPGRLEGSDK